ncbi:MAG: hypothetical protein K2W97_07960 [Chthoniobacterales bacterium]|nr:hypothetical protein [Chthoniobacterales bacterium]
MKFIRLSKLFFIPFLASIALLGNVSSVLADTVPIIVHETDSGSTVNLTVGQTVEFSLAENILNTTSWIPFIAWLDTANSIEAIGSPAFDGTQTPAVLNFFYSAKNAGQTMLVFYKDGVTSGIPNNNVQHPLIFMVDVK